MPDCTLSDNAASESGGAIYNSGGVLGLGNCTASNNSAFKSGGAIHNAGTLTLEACTLSENSTGGSDGVRVATLEASRKEERRAYMKKYMADRRQRKRRAWLKKLRAGK